MSIIYRYIFLVMILLYEKWSRFAFIRRAIKFSFETVKVVEIWHLRGIISAYHFATQQIAFRKSRYQSARFHQERNLNAYLVRSNNTLKKSFNSSNIYKLCHINHQKIKKLQLSDKVVFQSYSFLDCFDFYQYFRYFGDFRVAEFFRQQALQASLREQESAPYLMPFALNAALELGMAEQVLRFLHNKSSNTVSTEYIQALKPIAHALMGNRTTANRLWKETFRESDFRYYDYIEGRSVAIVGPASPLYAVGSEIDGFDVVVRTNFRTGLNLSADLFGSRTNVSYYNHATWTTRRDAVLSAANSLNWINLKGKDDDSLLMKLSPSFTGGARVFFQADPIFFSGYPMGIPNIIFDLIRFSPSQIKLFCANFYITGNDYNSNYNPEAKSNAGFKRTSESLRLHDPFSGFMLTKRLFEMNFISADSLSENALTTSRSEYACRLNEIFGRWTLM